MPLGQDRTLTQITLPAKAHMKKIIAVIQAKGIPTNGSMWLSSLILDQPIPMPNGNGHDGAQDKSSEEGTCHPTD